ncbi:MAG: hypothetical protein EZS28_040790, partial [Streblomastix strix]
GKVQLYTNEEGNSTQVDEQPEETNSPKIQEMLKKAESTEDSHQSEKESVSGSEKQDDAI